MHAAYHQLLAELVAACRGHYGTDLVSVAVYGSVGRGVPRPDSDVDLLVVAEGLADRHFLRLRDFSAVEEALAPRFDAAAAAGLHPDLSPVLMTPSELERGSMLLLDMTEDARIRSGSRHSHRRGGRSLGRFSLSRPDGIAYDTVT